MTAHDRGFVVPTWVDSSDYRLPKAARYALVDRLLARGTRVLCIATDERTVHAWVAGEGATMHYAYTAPELRKGGFARLLVAKMFGDRGPEAHTHWAPKSLVRRARLNPYLTLPEAA
jgi:GNAT superfamily N-acetyltransferase